MKTICFYFQVHQPWRLKRYRFFDMGRDHNYLDDLTNRSIMQKIARECYLPMNALLFNLIRQSEGRFRCTFSLTGLAVEQMRAYAPEVLDSFRRLARTGCVEFLAETYSHSLASLSSKEDFMQRGCAHTELMKKEFGVAPTAFRNTELIYSDRIGSDVAEMGFKTMLAEGARHVLGWKSPGYVYANALDQRLRLFFAQLQALGRHRVPFLQPRVGPMASHGGKIHGVARFDELEGMWSISSWITKPSASTSVPIRVFSTL